MKFETVFKGKTKEMDKDGAKIFLVATLQEKKGVPVIQEIKDSPMWFFAQVINKRIEAAKLPIKFTDHAFVAMHGLTKVVGGAVVILIDALTRFEGQTIDTQKLSDLYPMGFYTEETLEDYVDNYLKPRKVKWWELY